VTTSSCVARRLESTRRSLGRGARRSGHRRASSPPSWTSHAERSPNFEHWNRDACVTWPDGVPIRPVSDDTTGASSDDTTGASEESSDGEAASVGSVSCGCEVGTPPPPALLLLLFANVRLRRSRVSLIWGRGATKGRPDFDIVLAGLPIVRPGMPLMKLSTRTSAVLDATGKRTENAVVAKPRRSTCSRRRRRHRRCCRPKKASCTRMRRRGSRGRRSRPSSLPSSHPRGTPAPASSRRGCTLR